MLLSSVVFQAHQRQTILFKVVCHWSNETEAASETSLERNRARKGIHGLC